MSSFSVFDIASMAMSAQSVRLNTGASNVANEATVGSTPEEAYHAQYPIFSSVSVNSDPFSDDNQALKSVKVDKIVASTKPIEQRYDPSHPKANKDGYVFQSNVNVVQDMADILSASRSYQTSAQIFNTNKELMQQTLNLGK